MNHDTSDPALTKASEADEPSQPQRVAAKVRVTADLPREDVDRLERLADANRSNRTTALVRAIRTADLLQEASDHGSQVIIQDRDGTRREIVLL